MTQPAKSINYIPALDGVRGLAILLVLLYHARVPGFMGGFIGVDIFFVLSGYLITTILLHEHDRSGKINLGNFYLRRIYRIVPAATFFVIMGLLFSLIYMRDFFDSQINQAAYLLTYTYNWAIAFGVHKGHMKLAAHLWSLAVEMQYYLVWPIALIALVKIKNFRKMLFIVSGLVLVLFVWRVFLYLQGAGVIRIYYGTDTRLDGLLLGGLLAIILSRSQAGLNISKNMLTYSLCGLAIFISCDIFFNIYFHVFGTFLVSVFTFVLIAFLLNNPEVYFARMFCTKWLIFLGKISYSLYIWHLPIFKVFRVYIPWYQTVFFGTLFSLLFAMASYRFIELPFLRRKKKWRS